ncbi:hypothetical protein Daus18300_009847 [Diaporthe australafricana]|uniref:MalT-like TPR region domain-containing protein n=1 Tax=Diaporthe australafricana TaxID=127596 RepID=A0ABR3WCT9_9PEZI
MACNAIDRENGLRQRELKFMLPYVNKALLFAYYKHDLGEAENIFSKLIGEPGESNDLFANKKSFETGIVMFAMGSVMARGRRLPEALDLLRRAVDVLEQTHGEDAVFTLAATYRMAVCLFDLAKYEEAMLYLDKLNRAYKDYGRTFGEDFLYQKARALWKGGRTLHALCWDDAKAEGQEMLDDAMRIRGDVTGLPCSSSQEEALDDDDWDHLVNHQYR